jgi:hypothetical protein
MIRPTLSIVGMAGGLLLMSAASPTAAQPPAEAQAMADFFSGTLEIDVMAGNWSAKRYLSPDHTYREVGGDGELRGTWKIENGKICTTATHALGDNRPATYCNLGLGKHIGESWNDSDPVTDNTVMFRLTPGRA